MDMSFLSNSNIRIALLVIGGFSFFLFVLSLIFFVYEVKEKQNIAYKIKEYNEQFFTQTLKDIESHKTTKTVYDKIDFLLSRSQLKYKYSWNVGLFVFLSILMFFLGFFACLEIFDGIYTGIIIGFATAIFPTILAEFISTYKTKKLKSQLLSLIPILINNAKLSGGDVYRTIKDSSSKVKAPLRMYLEEFVLDYESGISPTRCFENLRYKVSDFRFKRIVDCLETHLYKGGNVVVTLSSLNKEYMAREVEEDRRKKQNSSTTTGIYFCVVANFFLLWMVDYIMPELIVTLKQNEYIIALGMLNTLISLAIGYVSTKTQTKESA